LSNLSPRLTETSPPTASTRPADSVPRPTNVRYGVLALLAAVAVIAYVERNSISILQEPIQTDFLVDKDSLSLLMATFFIGYSLMQLPAGWIADRWSTRKALTVCAVGWSLAGALMAVVPAYVGLFPLWLLAGVMQAGAFPFAMIAIRNWLPVTRRALGSGVLGSSMSLGQAISPPLTSMLLIWLSWRWTLVALSVPGIAWAALFYFWFRDRPADHWQVNRAELDLVRHGMPAQDANAGARAAAPPTPWRGLLTSPAMWALCSQHFFRAIAFVFFGTWFPTFLKETRGISLEEAALLTSPPLIAGVIGGLLGGYLSDWLLVRSGSRRVARQGFAAANLLICAVLFGAAFFAANVQAAVVLITVGTFFASLAGVCAYAITIDMGGQHVGTVFSLMNMCGNVGGAVCPIIVTYLVGWMGDWGPVIFLMAGCYVAAAVSWLLLNPNGTVLDHQA